MDVLNMSIGDAFQLAGSTRRQMRRDNLVDAGIVVVASIGNSGASGVYVGRGSRRRHQGDRRRFL